MALDIYPTNNPDYNPFSNLSDAQFKHIIDQGYQVIYSNPRPSLITGDVFYLNRYPTDVGMTYVVVSDTGVFAWDVKDIGSDEPTESSNLYSAVTFETAWNAAYSFVMSKK